MEIKLTTAESEEYFYNAMCNGLSELRYYGLGLTYDRTVYTEAKERLKQQSTNDVCLEDVLMEILRSGKSFMIEDIEGEGENDVAVNLEMVHDRMSLVPPERILNMIHEVDDAIDADVILQTILYKDIIFG
jgi:hypothetical protein